MAVTRHIAVAALALGGGGLAAAGIVPTPRAAPVAPAPGSRPFLAATSTAQPVDLVSRGYVEEEYIVRGEARAYDWTAPAQGAGGSGGDAVKAREPRVPYVTRVLIRRPADARKFSGRLIVELLDVSRGYEAAPLWGLSQEHFLRSGDAYAAVTVAPAAVAALKKFAPQRYGSLSLTYPAPDNAACALPAAVGGDPALAWDVIAQVGALLRSSSKENPFESSQPRQVLAGGYGEAGGYLVTFVEALHASERLGNEGPIFDGYLQAGVTAAQPLAACAAAQTPARTGNDVPIVRLQPQADVAAGAALRREDSDELGAAFRTYELAGAAHGGPYPAGLPARTDVTLAGGEPFDADELCAERPSEYFAGPLYNAAWAALATWAEGGMPAPRTSALGQQPGQEQVAGGLRLPLLDVPAAAYAPTGTTTLGDARARALCASAGTTRRFDRAQLGTLYRTPADYSKRVDDAIRQAVAGRTLLEADAAAVRAAAQRVFSGPR